MICTSQPHPEEPMTVLPIEGLLHGNADLSDEEQAKIRKPPFAVIDDPTFILRF